MLNDDSKTAEPTEENMTPSPGHGALRLPHSIHNAEHYQLTHNYCFKKIKCTKEKRSSDWGLLCVSYVIEIYVKFVITCIVNMH